MALFSSKITKYFYFELQKADIRLHHMFFTCLLSRVFFYKISITCSFSSCTMYSFVVLRLNVVYIVLHMVFTFFTQWFKIFDVRKCLRIFFLYVNSKILHVLNGSTIIFVSTVFNTVFKSAKHGLGTITKRD